MNRYQFHIAFNDKPNTAASKAVQDCKSILSDCGYRDLSVEDLCASDGLYLFKLLTRLFSFLGNLKPGSLVAVQYPLLSGNRWFKYLIKAARLRNVRFFCVVHDLDDLRYPKNEGKRKDIDALNAYDFVIVHNEVMKDWLFANGLTTKQIVLHAFDYLSVSMVANEHISQAAQSKIIAFAGNLSKSKFIYALDIIEGWRFNLYGPNYQPGNANNIQNICWNGCYGPDEVLTMLAGKFGLIWDGDYTDRLDTDNGNYLRYNYPHKLSLYLAAGLPVIAPRESAASSFITNYKVGVLIDDLAQLRDININDASYKIMKENAAVLSQDFKAGKFFSAAIAQVELEVMHLVPSGEHKALVI
jgi:hypothetical protein